MPPVLIAFFILLGAGAGAPAAKALVTPKDPLARPKLCRPAAVEYRTWTSSPRWEAKRKECVFTVFALATRERLVRLRVNGDEQLLDWSWSWEAPLPVGFQGTTVVEFVDPVGGAVLARHEVTETCWAFPGRQ